MNRVRVLLLGLLALFFSCSPVVAQTYLYYSANEPTSTGGVWGYTGPPTWHDDDQRWSLDASREIVTSYKSAAVAAVTCDNGTWGSLHGIPVVIYGGSVAFEGTRIGLTYSPITLAQIIALYPANTCPNVCNFQDSDGDSVCDSCDTSPGEPDKKHCIWYQFKVPLTNTVLFSMIDRSGNCDGSNTVITRNKSVPNATNTSSWNGFFSPMKYEINPPNCGGDDGDGQCKCDYDYNDEPFLHDQELVIDVALTDGLKNQLQQNDNDLNDDEKPNNCTTLKSNCSSSCATRGGVAASTCYTSGGQSYSNCKCSDDYNYSINNPVKDDSSSDTNENGSANDTGGNDSNSDGTDDFYAAVKGAIKDSGILSKQDLTNSRLGQISDDLGVINNNFHSLGAKLDGIDSGIDGLGGKLVGIGNDIQGLGSKLDSIDNKLGQGFEATGDAALPSSNDYDSDVENIEEDNLGEAIGNFISGGLPLVSYFKGTYIDIGSSSPALSTEIYGRTVSIDFTGLEDILNNMGLVLVAISTVLAFMIIVHKG